MRFAALAAIALLVSGCSSPEPGKDAAGPTDVTGTPLDLAAVANNTTLAPLPIDLELTGCLQLHTFFPFPVAVFAQIGFTMPEGFTFDSADGQTVNVLLAWWSCPGGRLNNTPNAPFSDVHSMFAAMPVRPPAALAAQDANPVAVRLDLLPLNWVIDEQLAADHLGGIAGLRNGYVDQGDVQVKGPNALGPVTAYSASAVASFGVFSVDPTIQPAPASSPEGRYRMWLSSDGANVNGRLDIVNGAGQALGSGHTDMRFNGDPGAGAPPATVGTAQVVDAVSVVVSYVRLHATA